MKKNKGIITLVGFLLVIFGFLALAYTLIGADISFLVWVDYFGEGTGLVIKLSMVLIGFVLVYLAQTDYAGEE